MAADAPVLVGRTFSLSDLADVARSRRRVAFDDDSRARVRASRAAIDALAAGGDAAPNVYGVNTGFGALSETRIGAADIRRLQRNLIRSHACGVGPALPSHVVRAMLLLRAQVLAKGHSGVREEVIDRLCAMLNAGVHPRVPSQGSVGASGDLAPLAHLALALIGEGEAQIDEGPFTPGGEALKKAGIPALELEAKEGLALINGTQLMAAIGSLALLEGERLSTAADVAGAMSVEALLGSRRPFDERLMRVRAHKGQAVSAANLRTVLGPSEIERSHANCSKVQDAYSLRCMPQVHGATRDALGWVRTVLEVEIDAVTDNPLVFLEDAKGNALSRADLISGGNFHGQYLALALDLAAMAVAELANVSERRVEQLVNPHLNSGLSPFLAPKQFSGLCSGFMIAQVAAASLVSENKVLSHPASVDSIPSSAGKEDHVSMGSVSALKLMRVVENVTHAVAIEVLAAAAGLDQRLPLKPSSGVHAAHAFVRSKIPPLTDDRPLHGEIAWVATAIRDGSLLRAIESEVGALA
jgi:histidine ammonia-lyase